MWIKICGIKSEEDADAVIEAGADAIGLNFFAGSVRCVSMNDAQVIARRCQGHVELVGVFVNESIPQVSQTCRSVGLTAVQFHGDESVADVQRFRDLNPGVAVIRAFRVGSETADLSSQYGEYHSLTPRLDAALVDAWASDAYGGTGKTVATSALNGHQELGPRLILAGGLGPSNVAELAKLICPWGVDTASGVESSPGIKSPELVAQFVDACRRGFPQDSPSTIA